MTTKMNVPANKQWPHAPEALLRGRLVYNVKFYGSQEVDQPKGSQPVKDAIRKMKFNKQLRKAEGQKTTPKVELIISVDGISINDPKSKVQQYKYPLHHISYCADEKAEKKIFTFIAKNGATGVHHCFVLGSEKNAEEITLTIGQAFDLAYKRFLEKQDGEMKQQKQFMLLQQQVAKLQEENSALKKRIVELEQQQIYTNTISNGSSYQTPVATAAMTTPALQSQISMDYAVPKATPAVGTRLENLLFDDDFNPISTTNGASTTTNISNGNAPTIPARIAPPPSIHRTASQPNHYATGNVPAGEGNAVDAFGMPSFSSVELKRVTDEHDDLQSGFSAGLSLGEEDFDLSVLDPLNS